MENAVGYSPQKVMDLARDIEKDRDNHGCLLFHSIQNIIQLMND